MGLRTAASAVSSNSDAAKIMAPALTEPVSHQSKISSPAQASSPRPIISDVTDTTANTQLLTENASGVDHHQYLVSTKTESQITNTSKAESFQLAFVNHTVSNGPTNGPSAVTHMDQINDHTVISEGTTTNVSSNDTINENIITNVVQKIQCTEQIQYTEPVVGALQEQHPDLLLQQQQQEHNEHQQIIQNVDIIQQEACTLSNLPNDSQTQNQSLIATSGLQQITPATTTINNNNNALGLQKDYLKDNAEMEQMLGDLSTSDIDLMQVLKSFESAPAGENLCDLAGSLALFNDVDVMNIGLEDVVTHTSPIKESPTQEILGEIEKKRAKMIRECDFMMRRLRKIQARNMGRHVSEEIYGVYEYAQQMIKRKERETKSISTMTPINQLQNDKHKLNSATSMKMLLKRIDQSATNQQTSPSSRLSSQPYCSSSSNTSLSMADHHINNSNLLAKHSISTIVPPFDQNGIQQMQQCAGLLATELKLINNGFDSDATASSSGGESADEMVAYNNTTQQPLSM